MLNHKKSLTKIHVAVLLFGSAGLFGKLISSNPVLIVFGRVVIASISFFVYFTIIHKKIKQEKYTDFFISGALLAFHWISFFYSIQLSNVAIGLLTYSTFPIFTTFLEPLFFKEKIRIKNIIITVISLIGVYILVPENNDHHIAVKGIIWGIVSGISFALLTIYNRKMTQKHDAIIIAFYQDLFAALLLLPFMFFIPLHINAQDFVFLIILGVFLTAFAHNLFIQGLKFVKAQLASIIGTLEPVYGIILAFFILNEVPTLDSVIGGIIIVAAVIMNILIKEEIR